MITWIFDNSQNIISVGEFVIIVIGGIFFALGTFGGKVTDRRNDSDKVADGLITRLQQTVDQNATDMTAMSARIDDQQKEIHILQGQNEAYFKIITLTNPEAAKVFDEAPEIYKIVRDTHAAVVAQAQALTSLTKAIETFINSLPPLMPVMKA